MVRRRIGHGGRHRLRRRVRYTGGPAGLVVGDTITSVGGQTVTSPTDISTVIASHAPGDSIPLVWVDANGAQHTATVQLASGPPT